MSRASSLGFEGGRDGGGCQPRYPARCPRGGRDESMEGGGGDGSTATEILFSVLKPRKERFPGRRDAEGDGVCVTRTTPWRTPSLEKTVKKECRRVSVDLRALRACTLPSPPRCRGLFKRLSRRIKTRTRPIRGLISITKPISRQILACSVRVNSQGTQPSQQMQKRLLRRMPVGRGGPRENPVALQFVALKKN